MSLFTGTVVGMQGYAALNQIGTSTLNGFISAYFNTREIAPLVLNGPPTVTGFAGGRPKVEEIVAYWPALVDKRVVHTKVEILS